MVVVLAEISGASRRMGEGNENLVYPSPWDLKWSLTHSKILRHGTSGFTSHPKEGVLRIFIALKNPSPWPHSNPRPLGPVASTLTTTPLRRLVKYELTYFTGRHVIKLLHYAFNVSNQFRRMQQTVNMSHTKIYANYHLYIYSIQYMEKVRAG
jgi:hypothetical protein